MLKGSDVAANEICLPLRLPRHFICIKTMKRRTTYSREDALGELRELGELLHRLKETNDEVLRRFKALEHKVKRAGARGVFGGPKPEEYRHLDQSSTIGSVAMAYIEFCREARSYHKHTVNNYSSCLSSVGALSNEKIGIGAEEFMKFFNRATAGINPNTRKTRLSVFRGLFIWAAENGIISSVPKI